MLLMIALLLVSISPPAHAQLNPRDIVIADLNTGLDNRGALLRVAPSTGTRTVLSDFGKSSQGELGSGPLNLASESSEAILVLDPEVNKLFRVNPITGQRTVLSDFGNPAQGPFGGQCSFGIAIEASGTILVTDCNNLGGSSGGLLFRIDPVTGQRTVLSDFGNPAQGLGQAPWGIAVIPVASENPFTAFDA